MRTIAITGSSGFIGSALMSQALARGLGVVALGRTAPHAGLPTGAEFRRFDPNDSCADGSVFDGVDGVVHLAGESVAGRWNPTKKAAIARSRIEGTRNLVDALARCARRPRVLLCASGAGYYGSAGDTPLLESAPPGRDFLAAVCEGWEREAERATALGLRVCALRTGLVLGNGGALAALRTPFTLFVGGPLGSGQQFVPWIHLDDVVALYLLALERDEARGPINAVAPDYATNARFSQAIGAALRRPSLLPAPGFALRAVLGEFAATLLGGQLAIPAAARQLGFAWSHANLERAMQAVLAPARTANVPYRFEATSRATASLDETFAFFSDAGNLERLTPPHLHFAIESVSGPLRTGTTIDYRLRLHGVPMRWRTMIDVWEPPHRFVDVQLHGPYALWRHEHRFRAVDGGIDLDDRVDYVLPFMPFSTLARPLVRADITTIFAYRRAAIATIFANRGTSASL